LLYKNAGSGKLHNASSHVQMLTADINAMHVLDHYKIHTTKRNIGLMLKLYFCTQFVLTPTCFDLPWSSSGGYVMDGLWNPLKLVH